jgi:hypothetical protein
VTDETEFQTPRVALVAGVLAVAVAFTFLRTFGGPVLNQLGVAIAESDELWRYRGLSTLVVLGGGLGALGAAMRFRLEVWQTNLGWSFRACSLAVVLAVVATSWSGLLAAAFAMGAAAGWVATTLATGMRASVGTRRLGIVVGGGLALSSLLAELAFIMAGWFGDPVKGAAIVIAMLLAATSVVVPFLTPLEPSMDMEDGYRGRGLLINWVVMLAVMGSAFAIFNGGGVIPSHGVSIVLNIVTPLVVGRWLDADHRRYALWAAVSILIVGNILQNTPGVGALVPLIAISWMTVIAFHFAARGGRVWVAAGTVFLLLFIAPNMVSWFTI